MSKKKFKKSATVSGSSHMKNNSKLLAYVGAGAFAVGMGIAALKSTSLPEAPPEAPQVARPAVISKYEHVPEEQRPEYIRLEKVDHTIGGIDTYLGSVRPEMLEKLKETDPEIVKEVKHEISQIIKNLNLKQGSDLDTQLQNMSQLFMHTILNSEYDLNLAKIKCFDDVQEEILDIHTSLKKKRSVCAGDAATLNLLLHGVDINSKNLMLLDTSNATNPNHAVVLVKAGEEHYIIDPTLSRTELKNGLITIDDTKENFLFHADDYMKRSRELGSKFDACVIRPPLEPFMNYVLELDQQKQKSDKGLEK